ncbi:SAM-dependent methyltransferase [Thermostaphylospora chromogena]|uniref:S-adenosyl methyltransferase n=1 Tax=Thermostaphylospora chromogena TaxID=35622 RepID=A0A1H1HGX2_9ACTN|nr:SAM-dependent methyltransferase [Thermostaphylospora chromogena]SDR24710.1 S-adenosyl methyltransferase [Thermostaphylospora chromogena]
METEHAPPGIDPNIPSPARIYDYLLGGKDNFAADRAAAEKLLELTPNAREGVRINRRFLSRAVRFLAGTGIRQFLDIGAGLPTQENVHQVAQRVAPDSRVVYVDNDPIVLAHGRALLAENERTIVVQGDLRKPEDILSDPEVTGLLDFDRPVGLLLVAVLHFIPDHDEVGRILATLRGRLAPGSGVVISHLSYGDLDEDRIREGREIYKNSTAGAVMPRTREQIVRFFDGFEVVEPGVVPTDQWRPEEDGEPVLPPLPGVDGYSGVGLLR